MRVVEYPAVGAPLLSPAPQLPLSAGPLSPGARAYQLLPCSRRSPFPHLAAQIRHESTRVYANATVVHCRHLQHSRYGQILEDNDWLLAQALEKLIEDTLVRAEMEGMRTLLRRAIERRFGSVPPALEELLARLPTAIAAEDLLAH